jgi:hypothetical protein
MSESDTSSAALHWGEFPLILIVSLLQAVVGGLVVGMLIGGLVGAMLGDIWLGTQIVAIPSGLFLFAVLVVAGLLPEDVCAPQLALPCAVD